MLFRSVKIAPGKYGLLSIPNKDNWTIIISKQTDVTSPAAYKQEMDIVRINAATADLKYKIENFAIVIDNIKSNQCEIGLYWDKTKVSFTVETDIDTRIMQQIATAMQGDKPPYFNAAMYYMDNGKDLNQALSWFEKAAAATPTAYWVHHQLANCLAKLGKKAEAKKQQQVSNEFSYKYPLVNDCDTMKNNISLASQELKDLSYAPTKNSAAKRANQRSEEHTSELQSH